MASHISLIDAALASKQINMSRRAGKSVPMQTNRPSFEAVLNKNLHKNQPVIPLNYNTNEPDTKFNDALRFVLEKEGSRLVKNDGGRESSKYGILQSTAKEHGYKGNIKDLTRSDAESIYRKLWEKSGAESLPFPLSTVHFDTYVNSPAAAVKMLGRSKGDTDVYLRLREQRYARLAEIKPEQYGKYLKGWNNRIKGLRTMVAQHRHDASMKA